MPNQLLRKTAKSFFVSANILVGFFLLLGSYGASFFNAKIWFIGIFASANFYFFILTLFFIPFWLFIKPIRISISMLFLMLCWASIKEFYPIHFTNGYIDKKNEKAVRVMTWNVELFNILEYKSHPEKKEKMFHLINNNQPDIVCFQELVAGDSGKKYINDISEFPAKLHLNNYYYSYNPIFDFDKQHHFGLAIFSRYPIVKKETVTLDPYNFNSAFQYVDVVKEKDTIRIVNIHLQTLRLSEHNRIYLNHPSLSNQEDVQESKNILTKYKIGLLKRYEQSDFVKMNINQSPHPVILCGDFNDVPNSYSYFTIGKNMTNAFAEKGSGLGSTFDGISPTLRIDNIFTDKAFTVLQVTRFKNKLSDHYPISADILLTEN